MKSFLAIGLISASFVGLAAVERQAGKDSYESLVKDMLDTIDEITKTLQTIKDRDSAVTAQPQLKKSAEHVLVLRKKAELWKQPNKEEKERLEKEYAPKMEVAVKKLRDASAQVKSVPGGAEAVAELAILADKKDKDKKKL